MDEERCKLGIWSGVEGKIIVPVTRRFNCQKDVKLVVLNYKSCRPRRRNNWALRLCCDVVEEDRRRLKVGARHWNGLVAKHFSIAFPAHDLFLTTHQPCLRNHLCAQIR